ncbi:S24/S26 family peptidase [Glycomyces sp. NPDC048151]|uniref:S24/S26 family peptidase n=1 Tax=Glycomyces sp. NPDC048151 TaxID=3364002 RepID=UPI00371D3819
MTSSNWFFVLALVAVAVLMAESVRQLRRRWVLVKVEGVSMEPALRDGQEVLAKRTRRIATGDIVVVAAPDPQLGWADITKAKAPWWVKRVTAVAGEPMPGASGTVPPGHYFLGADNPAGEDSRRHGPCPANLIVGSVIRSF